MTGKLIIFSAPSGSGKSTIINYLLTQNLNLAFSISATSRPPRGTEQHGVEYFFLTPEEFRQRIENNEFLEYEEVYDFLKNYSLDEAFIERVAYLVGHHHTYKDVDGLDYQILLEADFLVNGDESNLTKEAIEKMKKNVFKTKTGIELLNHIFEL